jgi:hypothetical protein
MQKQKNASETGQAVLKILDAGLPTQAEFAESVSKRVARYLPTLHDAARLLAQGGGRL